MNRIVILALTGVCSFGQAFHLNFYNHTPSLDLTGGNGSFAADAYRHPNRFLEIGGLGLANSGGSLSTEFGPLDLTEGYGSFGDFRTTRTEVIQVPNPAFDPTRPIGPFNPGPATFERTVTITEGDLVKSYFMLSAAPGVGLEPWRVSIFDIDGDNYSFTLTPRTSPGVFTVYSHLLPSEGVPEMDWTQITGIAIGGDGEGDLFHAGFRDMRLSVIPEAREYAMMFGVGLIGFAIVRKRFWGC